MKSIIILLLTLVVSASKINAQEAKTSELFLTLKKVDSIFFERCFNQCDMAFLEKAVHKDLDFYHDKGGMQTRQVFIDNIKKNICSTPDNKPIRKVVEESLEVFPMYNNDVLYGAIQSGIHHFYRRRPGKPDEHTGIARFTHLYLLENGNWILRESLSFDHKDAK
jgi:hypothetical protein